jgi:LAS superfamily LD-carboxypeptidase LdcB
LGFDFSSFWQTVLQQSTIIGQYERVWEQINSGKFGPIVLKQTGKKNIHLIYYEWEWNRVASATEF